LIDHPQTTARQLHNSTTVTVGLELGATAAAALREDLLAHLRRGAHWLVIDLSCVDHCDAVGLAVLLGVDRRARLSGGGLRLAAPTAGATHALQITGLHRHFAIYPTAEAAADRGELGRRHVALI
jgi:anti-anti-sigma factor